MKELREMSIDEIKDALKEILDKIDAAAEGGEIDILEEKSNEYIEELERRDAEKKELEKREAQRKNILDIVNKNGTEIRKGEMEKMAEIRTFAIDTPEYRKAYLKKLQGKDLDAEERAAMTASAAIPTETMNMIVGKLDVVPLIAAVDVMNIPGNVSFPAEGTINNASWVAMGTASTDSADALSSISLAAYKLIKTVTITADIKAMAVPAFESWLTDRLANKIQFAVDAAILVGTGTNQATGILTTQTGMATGTFTKSAMSYKDLMNIIAALPTEYTANASFVMPRALFYGEVLGMTDTTGNRVVVADAQAAGKFNVLGYPVIVDDNCTADNVIFGDLKEYKFNFAQAIEVTADDSTEFRTGNRVYRAMCLADGKVANPKAFAVYTRASS